MASKMDQAFEKAKDIDFDLRFMAAQDLCEILDSDSTELDEDQKVRIMEVFIKQLDDGNKEVRSHAVRCISKILYRINELTLKKTIDKIFENFVKEDIDIYSVCLKTIVNNIEFVLGANLCTNCIPHLHKYIIAGDSSDAAVEQSLDIFTAILKKFPQPIRHSQQMSALIEDDILINKVMRRI